MGAGSEADAASQGTPQVPEEDDEQDATDHASRPHGLNRMRTVQQQGEMWCTLLREPAEVHPDWVRLHNLRAAMLQKHNLPNTAYLQWSRCREVMRQLKDRWSQEEQDRKATLQRQCARTDGVHRTMTSCLRTAMYERFGGTA